MVCKSQNPFKKIMKINDINKKLTPILKVRFDEILNCRWSKVLTLTGKKKKASKV